MKNKIHNTIKRFNEILPRKRGAKFFIAGSFLMAALASCDKDSPVGLDVQPEGDLLHTRVTDTASITTFTVREDSVKTDELPSGTAIIGSYNDPVFGYSAASAYAQFLLPTNAPNFSGATLDSIVLSLAYDGTSPFYGSITDGDMQTFRVYQVVESLSKDASYYGEQTATVYPTDIGFKTFNPNVVDSVQVGNKKEKPQLRIRLDDTFGNLLLTAGATNLANNTNFLQYFKGLNIRPDNGSQPTGTGALLYFNLLDGKTGLTLYYQTATEDSLSYRMLVNSSAARFSHFEHNYPSSGPISAQLQDPSQGQNISYVQAMSGVKTKISFPTIAHLLDSGRVAINRAELVIKADPSYLSNAFHAPDKLFLVPVTSTGNNGDLLSWPDFFAGASSYGGTYNATTNEYRFNVSRYVQAIIDGKTADYGLYLTIAGSAVNGDRLVIGGGSNSAYGMKLRLTYTKLD
jgi:hypothetical protein